MSRKRNILLYPFSLVYGAITAIRNFLYDTEVLTSHEFSIPVICIGNITAGGTGKTPHAEYLIRLLGKDFKTAFLSRGYLRKSRGFITAAPDAGVKDIGDEPLQIRRKFPEITVAVDSDRVRGVKTILAEFPDTEVIILDDGFQHRSITPGLSILLTDHQRLMISDHLLPYGNLRESLKNIRRADIIVVTKSPSDISPMDMRIIRKNIGKAPYQELFFTSLGYGSPVPIFSETPPWESVSTENEKNINVLLVTGIANPDPLKDYLTASFGEVVHLSFRDHHDFSATDIEKVTAAFTAMKGQDKVIITTEKDAQRLGEIANIAQPVKASAYFIPLTVVFREEEKKIFDNLILNYVRKNKRNNRVSEIQGLHRS
ncbi:MAG: tetraacyldisaccharide 4'-kinase [Bacteroidales bacterium]|jgi:tetraacyldisaccharide 4'-kinase|nr:tetraacyldisaccharide 4'-kinase [Bacteroidales bacterium]